MANAGQAQMAINGLAQLAIRLLHGEDPEPLPGYATRVAAVAEIDPAIFDAYEGRYQLTPEFALNVTREGDRFFAEATGQERIEILPESETTFFNATVQAQLTFGRDDPDGPVTHLILRQGGQEMRLERIR
jgi:hypothetical protein